MSLGVDKNEEAVIAKGATKEINKIDKRKRLGRILSL
jgi:hypothetical protein